MLAPELLVDLLEERTEGTTLPAWFEILADEETKTMAFVRHDDLQDLFGWRTTEPFTAVGVVAGGQSRDLPGREAVGPSREGWAAQMVAVVDRDGGVWSRARLGDDEVIDGGCEGGRLLDALRRCLDLPTAPPPDSSAAMIATLWLSAVIATGEESRVRLDWPAVVDLHPAAQVLADRGEVLRPDEADMLVRTAARAWTWERLRGYTTEGGGLAHLVAPDLAAWMDDGMFARWASGAAADPHLLWGRVVPLLEPGAALALAETLDGPGGLGDLDGLAP